MPSGYSSDRSSIEREIAANSQQFFNDWLASLSSNAKKLSADKLNIENYARLSALNGVVSVISGEFDLESRKFILEAQNDALLSHVSATFGSWRLSQQSLRSFIENSLCAIYYIDHPIELKLWEDEKFRIGFKEISKYVASHPYISRYKCVLDSIGDLDNEYSELSKSVHGSARDVRMTDQVSDILLWDSSIARYGKWTTRQRGAMSGIVILFLAMFERKFKGAQHLEIRRALNFVLTPKKIRNVVEQLRINIPKIHPN